MAPDDEILLSHASDESQFSYERVQSLRNLRRGGAPSDLTFALAEFELHGATLRSLRGWYPQESRVRAALADWEILTLALQSQGLPVGV